MVEKFTCPTSFQFTPAHGGRQAELEHTYYFEQFQFTPAHGGRQAQRAASRCLRARFNSRPRTAGDVRGLYLAWKSIGFQFTPAHGGRPHRAWLVEVLAGFNSRPRTAGDECVPYSHGEIRSFNSRPRTAGDSMPPHLTDGSRFQFTPAHGGRRSG